MELRLQAYSPVLVQCLVLVSMTMRRYVSAGTFFTVPRAARRGPPYSTSRVCTYAFS